MKDLADWLQALRIEADMTQPELAALLGCNQGQVSRYETGKRVPSVDMLRRYITVYGDTVLDPLRARP